MYILFYIAEGIFATFIMFLAHRLGAIKVNKIIDFAPTIIYNSVGYLKVYLQYIIIFFGGSNE